MKSVTITEFQGVTSKKLTADQARLFFRELRRVKIFYFFSFSYGRPKARINPDIIIEVKNGSRTTEYELFGSQVLYSKRHNKRFQFYFGYLLLQWLYEP